MTDEADIYVVLAKLLVAFLKECNNQRGVGFSSVLQILLKYPSWCPHLLDQVHLVYSASAISTLIAALSP